MPNLTILWFVNVPFTAEDVSSSRHAATGGWLLSLAAAISPDVKLHVTAIHPYRQPFVPGGQFDSHFVKPKSFRLKMILRSIFNRPLTDGDILNQMRSIIDTVEPDLIHIHGTEKGYIEILPHAKTKGIPVLVSLQGILTVISRFYLGGYDYKFLNRFWHDLGGSKRSLFPKRLLSDYVYLKKRAKRERDSLRMAQFIDGRTHWDRRLAKLFSPQCEYFHIDRALRPEFYVEKWAPPRGDDVLCIHTTLGDSLAKGLDVIAEAALILEAQGRRVRWTVAGLDDGAKSIKAACKKLNIRVPPKSLEFVGRLNASELIAQMKASHIYVMASYIENSPNNLAEAMMLGLPCVATLAGGTGTYLMDRETGVLVQPGDSYGVAAAALELSNDQDLALKLGRRARQIALERHNLDRIREQLLGSYRAIVKRG